MSVLAGFIVPHPPLIVPSVGRGEERKIQATVDAFEEVVRRIVAIAPDTIVVSSPHATLYGDYFHVSPGLRARGDMGNFGAPQETLEVAYDAEFVEEFSELARQRTISAGTDGEREPMLDHATFVPLYFVNKNYTDYKLVRIGLSGLSPLEHYEVGKCIADTSERLGRRTVFIASGDLSHKLKKTGPYGYAPEGPAFDRQLTTAAADGDFMRMLLFDEDFCDRAAECGLRSFQIMAGALDGKALDSELLSYEGPFGVGYCVASFKVLGTDDTRKFAEILRTNEKFELGAVKEKEDAYVKLARSSLETYVRTRRRAMLPQDLPQEMLTTSAGVFVSLKKRGRLRGCIGTIQPATSCVAEEILRNAVSAGCEDPRFSPVREYELPELVYSVDVLGPVEPVSSPEELDAEQYGLIVTSGKRRGLLLPNLDGVDTVAQQIAIAKQKAGIRSDEPCELERFKVVRHT